MSLSTQPYKGARDFYPEDKQLQKFMFNTWRRVVERFGYEEYDAPILEPLDIYLAKTGEEIVNEQTYVFEDRGGRKVVIRPEMTPTVSRMVAAKRQELGYPLRWYSIPNLWRYERPQRGRLREHWQLNVDIFGVEDISAEKEMLILIDSIFKDFGATSKDFEIRVNHRNLVNYLLSDYLGLDEKAQHSISKLIDKMHKMSKPAFIGKIDEILSPKQREAGITESLLGILEAKSLKDLPEKEQKHESALELKLLIEQLNKAGITNVTFDGTLMRGFDYYTGIVFEVFDTDPENNRSMLGGGRYDGLVSLFGVDAVPTVGFGWGDVTLANFLSTHHLLPVVESITDIFLIPLSSDEETISALVSNLRNDGLNIAVGLHGKKIADQIKTAEKKSIKYVLIAGDEEIKANVYTLKDIKTGNEQKLSYSDIFKEFVKK
ncbi:MAG: histidine--tRNA ligase [Candidatus Saccharimonadales bacterium]